MTVTTEYDRYGARTPPVVPADPDRELVWVEWEGVGPDAFHPYYHRTDEGSPYDPIPDSVLTNRARAADLAQQPCPTCYPDREG